MSLTMEGGRLSKEQADYIINKIQCQVAIWDVSSTDYKNLVNKSAAWMLIQTQFKSEFGIDISCG